MGDKKIRVYNLAKEFKLSNAEMIAKLAEHGIEVKSHMSGVETSVVEGFRKKLAEPAPKKSEPVKEEKPAKKAKPVKKETKKEPKKEAQPKAKKAKAAKPAKTAVVEEVGEISLKSPVVVKDLAEALGMKANALIVELMGLKVMANLTQTLEHDIVEKVAENHNKIVTFEKRDKSHIVKKGDQVAPEDIKHKGNDKDQTTRPPVVAFMGHVDHGKTSLQDALRKTSVTAGEAGGITQHIGSSVLKHDGSTITMLDTPGHAAFSAMRARGANVTDIAILVVAANDGVMPQTIEAIRHARAADIPIIVAMNKMDLEDANPDNVLVQLQQQNLMTEDWGGEIGCVRVSAITGEGLDELLDRIVLEAEMMELSANPKLPGKAVVVEAQMQVGVGVQANILVQDGTIKVGDTVICGSAYGRVKALINSTGDRVKSVGPSMPAQLIGLNELPEVGTALVVCKNERQAKKIAQERAHEARENRLASRRPGSSLEDLFSRVEESRKAELSVIVKADVKGSLEAIEQALNDFPSDRVRLNIIDSSIGAITENDIVLAESSNAFVMGFHVRVNPGVNKAAERAGIDIRLYSVIYELLQDVHDALEGKLEPERREETLGEAVIAEVFVVGNKGQKVCGSRVNEGYVAVGCKARVYRKKELIYNGSVSSLRRFKDDVKEVKAGFECGILLDNFKDFEEGDIISLYKIIEKKATL